MDESDYLTLIEAARRLGVSRWTIYRRVQEGALAAYESHANRRVKLVKRADLEAMAAPKIAAPVAIREEQGDYTDGK